MAESHRPTTGKPAKGRKPSREFRSIQNTPLSRMLNAITRTAATTLDTRTWNDCPTTGIVPASSNLGILIDCSMHTFTPCEIAWQALSRIEQTPFTAKPSVVDDLSMSAERIRLYSYTDAHARSLHIEFLLHIRHGSTSIIDSRRL
jgi:hypothetical protein